MHKGTKVLFQRTVKDLCLPIGFRVIGSAHTELGAAKLEEYMPKFANKDRGAIINHATGYLVVFADQFKE